MSKRYIQESMILYAVPMLLMPKKIIFDVYALIIEPLTTLQ
jgi:hypothetical protein